LLLARLRHHARVQTIARKYHLGVLVDKKSGRAVLLLRGVIVSMCHIKWHHGIHYIQQILAYGTRVVELCFKQGYLRAISQHMLNMAANTRLRKKYTFLRLRAQQGFEIKWSC
jgi:hypothetical protein